MAVKVEGAKMLLKRMSLIGGDVNLAGRNEMRRGVREIRDRARDYAPVEFGNLENAIQMQENYVGAHHWVEEIYIEESDPAPQRGPDITVGKYARYAHQNVGGGIGKGEGSIAKAARLGVRVGPRFMKRAFDELKGPVQKRIEEAIAAAIERRAAKGGVQQVARPNSAVVRASAKPKVTAKSQPKVRQSKPKSAKKPKKAAKSSVKRDKTRKVSKTPKRRAKKRGRK